MTAQLNPQTTDTMQIDFGRGNSYLATRAVDKLTSRGIPAFRSLSCVVFPVDRRDEAQEIIAATVRK